MEGDHFQEEPRPVKRQKVIHQECLPVQQNESYTIAWICALHIEMAAARAMLDEIHAVPPRATNDTNSYVLGGISGHNIVIACLPEKYYGLINAATVVANMTRTFSAISTALMVGIGGGVPSKEDIRLGDIVVGTRVMQYDLGKIMADGKFERTALPRTNGPLLGTAITSLRAKHELGPSQVPMILEQRMKDLPEYRRPNAPDRLFDATYEHRSSNCDECDPSKLVKRARRESSVSKIHYGAIASGNQVMKHGTTRDNIARELDVICFEMEAAGLMDTLPCLPIRGICDYSDSHKTKEWQRYAAATAAAYARELVQELPSMQGREEVPVVNLEQPTAHDHRQQFLNSLHFNQMNFRKLNIKKNYSKTCQWLLNHPEYKAWLDPARFAQCHGFLWLSGKPGAGKSTIMKFAYSKMKNKVATASFFFNARGEYLEKSVIGMYRSLLHQLLNKYPDLQTILDEPDNVPRGQVCPSLNVLKDVFYDAVAALGQRHFVCFIDALDECDEQQIRDMIDYFEDLAEQCMDKCIPFRATQKTWNLMLRIVSRIKNPMLSEELKTQLLEKAKGVFMWVILVVDILNKEWHRGGLALRKRLAEIPSDLSDLFKDILRRDTENMEHLRLCIRWILFAERPLHPNEFYHALWSGLVSQNLVDDHIPIINPQLSTHVAVFVTSSSKGLAEVTSSQPPTVQFIHESVRDFLIKDHGLHELWPEMEEDWEASSHVVLRQCCDLYLNHRSIDVYFPTSHIGSRHQARLVENKFKAERKVQLSESYPFLEYATKHIFRHANAAAESISQNDFLSDLKLPKWIRLNNLYEKFESRKYGLAATLFYILADQGHSSLIRSKMQTDPDVHVEGDQRYRYPIFAALAGGHKDAVAALLGLRSIHEEGSDMTEGLNSRKDLLNYKYSTPVTWAANEGRLGILKRLLQDGLKVDQKDKEELTALHYASENGHETIVRYLVEKGADINLPGIYGVSPLHSASRIGHEAVVRYLVEKGADINSSSIDGMSPLHYASQGGYETVVRYLVKQGADINPSSIDGMSPLHYALQGGYETVVRYLVKQGADINPSSIDGMSPLYYTSQGGYETVVRYLVEKGADINPSSIDGMSPLHYASQGGYETVVRYLVKQGADINPSSIDGMSPLYYTSQGGYETVVRYLVEKGADINPSSIDGMSPLHYASQGGYETVVRYLVKQGADINLSSIDGMSPLDIASRYGHEAIVRYLVEEGAEINLFDKYGVSPLYYAS
ncbi:Pfs NACHT and ankyrin domain protein [Penicillium chermesinum]|nr:Pfs NACHT and ankyrin domain protein [Penicillium chermesinum]